MSHNGKRLNVREASKYLGISVSVLNRWRMADRLNEGPAFHRLGRRVVYDIDDLDAWLAMRRVPTVAAA